MNPVRCFLIPSYINRVISGYRHIATRIRPLIPKLSGKARSRAVSFNNMTSAGDLDALIELHAQIVSNLQRHGQAGAEAGTSGDPLAKLRRTEVQLRNRIVAWPPKDRDEAYRKVAHVARVIVAGIAFEHEAVRHVLDSVQMFIDNTSL